MGKKSAREKITLKKDKKKSGVDGLDILGKTTHHIIQCKAHSYFCAVPHPPTRKWPLIIELLLTLPITNDTLSTVMNTFCWGLIWLTGQCWSWPYRPLSTTCWFLPCEWTHRETGQSTPSSEHSVVMSVEGKTTLCLKQSSVDSATHTHTLLLFLSPQGSFSVQLQQQFWKHFKLAVCHCIQTWWVTLSSDTSSQI